LKIRAVYPTTCSAYAPSRIFVIQEVEVVVEVVAEKVEAAAILQLRLSARAAGGRTTKR
jgi:hypothetical protein